MHRIEAYVRLAIIFIIIISIVYLPILFELKKKGKTVIRQMSYIGLICSIFLIIFATCLFMPINFHSEAHIINLKPFNWIGNTDSFDKFVVEKIPNIMLFIPLGFFIPAVFKKNEKVLENKFTCFCSYILYRVFSIFCWKIF